MIMGLGVSSFSQLSDLLAESHNKYLMWLNMADNADSKESSIIQSVMYNSGYSQNIKGRYLNLEGERV